jgi:hypothetical protein
MDDGTGKFCGFPSGSLIYSWNALFSCQYPSRLLAFPSHLLHLFSSDTYIIPLLSRLRFSLPWSLHARLLCALNYSLFHLKTSSKQKNHCSFLSQKLSCKTTRRTNPLFLRIQSILQQKLRPRRILSILSR